jgi:hypothetical protein
MRFSEPEVQKTLDLVRTGFISGSFKALRVQQGELTEGVRHPGQRYSPAREE